MNPFVPDAALPEKWCYWLAAAIDFEGCLRFYKKPYNQRGTWVANGLIANTHRGVLELAASIVGGGSIGQYHGGSVMWKPRYYYHIGSKVLRVLLPQLVDILVIKHEQALVLMEALALTCIPWQKRSSWQDARLEAIYWEMKNLNRRGPN